MKIRLLQYIVCPLCKGELRLGGEIFDGEEVKEGKLKCERCIREYLIVNFVPRFVDSDDYVKMFSFEWSKHAKTQLDSANGTLQSEETFRKKTGFRLEALQDAVVLDVGCGMGRFSEVASKYGGEVVGIDYSYSVESAFENLGLQPNVHFIQADVFCLPFREETFDYIFSIGVLDHTPNTKEAFQKLPNLLKRKGEIAVWVYSDEGWRMKVHNRISDFLRLFTTRMPIKLLYALCHIAIPLSYLKRIKVFGKLFYIVPSSTHSDPRWRVLDTFDWYSPRYQWKHTYAEVVQWFQEAGLKDIIRLSIPVSVRGRK